MTYSTEEDYRENRDRREWEERGELFRLTPEELQRQPAPIRYQRMRYERSIEATLYVGYLNKRGLPRDEALKRARIEADRIVANWDQMKNKPGLFEV